jgi:hypothetical protein
MSDDRDWIVTKRYPPLCLFVDYIGELIGEPLAIPLMGWYHAEVRHTLVEPRSKRPVGRGSQRGPQPV